MLIQNILTDIAINLEKLYKNSSGYTELYKNSSGYTKFINNSLAKYNNHRFFFAYCTCPVENAYDGIYISIYVTDNVSKHLTNCWISADGLYILTNFEGKKVSLADPECITKICNNIIESV